MNEQDFDRLLLECVKNATPTELLTIPGIYEILSDFYNQPVFEAFQEEQHQERGESGVYEVYDNGGKTCDRYTVIFDNDDVYFMSENANQPNGVCLYAGEAGDFEPQGKEIDYCDLPAAVKDQIKRLQD
jgi:hypothetical protein